MEDFITDRMGHPFLNIGKDLKSLNITTQIDVSELSDPERLSATDESDDEVQTLSTVIPIADSINNPSVDPYTFIKAEDFFDGKSDFHRPFKVTEYVRPDGSFDSIVETGAMFRFNDDTLLLVQFIRPKVWRFRFESKFRRPQQYKDFNS